MPCGASIELGSNFTLTSAERVRAAVAGPLAYVRRKRAIEDLEDGALRSLRLLADEAARAGRDVRAYVDAHPSRPALEEAVRALGRLIERHNRYYPIEANLAVCIRTGELLEKDGEVWRPIPPPSFEELMERAKGAPG